MSEQNIMSEARDDADDAKENVASQVQERAPEPPPVPAPPVPSPPPVAESGTDDLRQIVTGLSESLATLSDLVQSSIARDRPADNLPWTHRGGSDRRKESD